MEFGPSFGGFKHKNRGRSQVPRIVGFDPRYVARVKRLPKRKMKEEHQEIKRNLARRILQLAEIEKIHAKLQMSLRNLKQNHSCLLYLHSLHGCLHISAVGRNPRYTIPWSESGSKYLACLGKNVRSSLGALPETNSSHLKMDGWNISFIVGWPIFRGYVSLPEGTLPKANSSKLQINGWKMTCSFLMAYF